MATALVLCLPSVAPPVQYGQQPPPQYGQQPPQQHSSQPGFQPPMYAPPAYEQGNQPYQGFAPPTYAASQQMSPPPHQQSAPSFQVGVVVEQKIAFSPLSYGSSFVAFIRSHRHHNKYISLDQHMEICFTERPTMHWNFILSNTRDCYFVVCQVREIDEDSKNGTFSRFHYCSGRERRIPRCS